MKLKIKNRFLIFPVNTLATSKRMSFAVNGEEIYCLDIRLDNFNPNYFAYIDVSRFSGQTVDVSVVPEMELSYREADEMDIKNLYSEPLRPQVHFTTKNGWINDPNGLIFIDGVYHMFYQYNPAEPQWGNMHWGHAESRDLIHWEEKYAALFPDGRGTMFSGSAVTDEKNLLGMNTENTKAALLFYTTTEPFCQHMSYSTDNFKTVVRYSDKPVVPNIKAANRDPKVIFCEELNCYIMILYLFDSDYCILLSDNLTDWKEIQRFSLEGDNECPDIFPICTENGMRKWIIIGAHDKYMVGNFVGGKFVAEQPVLSLHYGKAEYAGQTFSGLTNGRTIRMVWDKQEIPGTSFCGQMGIPMEMSFSEYNGTFYLEANPVKEIEGIYKNSINLSNILLLAEKPFVKCLEDAPYLIKFKSGFYDSGIVKIIIFGIKIELNFSKNEIKLGSCAAPISLTQSDMDITAVIDRCSVELYADGGKILLSCMDTATVCDRNIPYLSVETDFNATLDSVEINSLKSIWSE